jgi:hypothetical protein
MSIDWVDDPAAHGPRVRAFPKAGVLVAYPDGRWLVIHRGNNCEGREASLDHAKERAIRVYSALTEELS